MPESRSISANRGNAQNLASAAYSDSLAGRYRRAIAGYERALRLNPRFAEALSNLGRLLQLTGDSPRASAFFAAALECKPELGQIWHNYLVSLLYLENCEPEAIATAHRQWGKTLSQSASTADFTKTGERLRIGYITGGLREGPQYFFLPPLFQAHDRKHFIVFCYSNCPHSDAYTDRAKRTVDHWRDISHLSDGATASRIRRDRIDILVDAGGHFADGRIELFAHRAAPVQAGLSQYPATTGLEAIDYRITSEYADPPGMTDRFYTERLLRLPRGFAHACYAPPEDAPAPGETPALRSGNVTFGSFNKLAKIGPATIHAWAGILRLVPKSTLLIHHVFNGAARVPAEFRQPLQSAFSRLGIDSSRIRFAGYRGVRDHMALFRKIDILLDPFPYNGMTTTCESLWMEVPVVVLAGNAHHSRVGVSLLSAVGLNDWIANTESEYIQTAVSASRDPSKLQAIRSGLRSRMRSSPLVDAARYARAVEQLYIQMIRRVR